MMDEQYDFSQGKRGAVEPIPPGKTRRIDQLVRLPPRHLFRSRVRRILVVGKIFRACFVCHHAILREVHIVRVRTMADEWPNYNSGKPVRAVDAHQVGLCETEQIDKDIVAHFLTNGIG